MPFILSLLLFFSCVFVGCESEPKKPKVDFSTPEYKKSVLLKELDRKFENPEVHFKLGQLYQADGNWLKAEYHYNVALDFKPAYGAAQAAMVKCLADSGNKNKSQQYAKTYMNQASNSATATLDLAEAFDKQGLDEYALICYQQALNIAPNSPEVNKGFGYYYLYNKDINKAKEYFSRSFQLNPNQPDVAGELGRLGVVVKIPPQTQVSGGTPAGQLTPKTDKKPEPSKPEVKPQAK